MILPKQVNLAQLAYLQHQADEEKERQARVIKARELYAGYMDEILAEETADYLIGGEEEDIEGINLMAIALNTTVRRLNIQSIKAIPGNLDEGAASSGTEADDKEIEAQNTWIKRVYKYNKVANLQRDLHRWTERDGEAFLIIDFKLGALWPDDPTKKGLPKFYIHERYTDAGVAWKEIPGSSDGCKAHYRNNDHNQELDMVSKRWIEQRWEEEEFVPYQRMNLYIAEQGDIEIPESEYMPARIEKYVLGEGGEWDQYKDEGDMDWPLWWTVNQTEAGESLPLPVIHFRNEEMVPGSKRLWGIQHGMDQLFASLLGAETMSGMQMLVALGFFPTTDGNAPADDGSNLMKVGPRQIIGTSQKGPREADVKTIEPSPIQPILEGMDKLAIYCSFVGSLPVSNFIFSRAVASSETLRQGDAELVGRVNELRDLLEVSWQSVFTVARQMDTLFGDGNWSEKIGITVDWLPAERRDINYLHKEAEAKKSAAVPAKQILTEVYNYEEREAEQFIEEWLSEQQMFLEATQEPQLNVETSSSKTVSKTNDEGEIE